MSLTKAVSTFSRTLAGRASKTPLMSAMRLGRAPSLTPAVAIISMIAEIGGYASLLLGFSLFNLTDLGDFFAVRWKRVLKAVKGFRIMGRASDVIAIRQ